MELQSLKGQMAPLVQEYDWLLAQLKLSRKKVFGPSSAQAGEEVMDQRSIMMNEAEAFDAKSYELEPAESHVKAHTRKRRSGSLEDVIPEGLPVETIEHRLPPEERLCPVCGTELVEIGREICRTLKIELPRYRVVEDVYDTYACKQCEKESDEALLIKTPKKPTITASESTPLTPAACRQPCIVRPPEAWPHKQQILGVHILHCS